MNWRERRQRREFTRQKNQEKHNKDPTLQKDTNKEKIIEIEPIQRNLPSILVTPPFPHEEIGLVKSDPTRIKMDVNDTLH